MYPHKVRARSTVQQNGRSAGVCGVVSGLNATIYVDDFAFRGERNAP